MPHSTVYRAKRSLVSVLLRLAAACGLALDITRESEDGAVLQAYRRVVKKVHPDKGGSKKRFQELQGAKEAWETARQTPRPAGNPELSASSSGSRAPTHPTTEKVARYGGEIWWGTRR